MAIKYALVRKALPQNPQVEVLVPNYKEPILPVNHGGAGWYGLQAYEVLYDEGGNSYPGKLLCHECGQLFEELGHHIKAHNLTANSYKNKYGLLRTRRLVSDKISQKRRDSFFKHPEINQISKDRFRRIATLSTRNKGKKKALQFFNRNDTCPSQLLRKLSSLAEIYGTQLSISQVKNDMPSLVDQLKWTFGSFNKAKQLVGLSINESGYPHIKLYPEHLILEDMICFSRKNGRWPTNKDYRNKRMICSWSNIHGNGNIGLLKLREKAIQLKEEQDKRPSKKDTALIANRIEMEYAGTARR